MNERDQDQCQLIGEQLDALGVRHHPDEGELVSGALVLMKVTSPDGHTYVRMANSEGLSWIDRVGMLQIAQIREDTEIRAANPA